MQSYELDFEYLYPDFDCPNQDEEEEIAAFEKRYHEAKEDFLNKQQEEQRRYDYVRDFLNY